MNCTAPRYIPDLIRAAHAATDKPILVYPNSGETYDPQTKTWSGEDTCAAFAHDAHCGMTRVHGLSGAAAAPRRSIFESWRLVCGCRVMPNVQNAANVAVDATFAIFPLKWQVDARENGAELIFLNGGRLAGYH